MKTLKDIIATGKILLLDGGTGTLLQNFQLDLTDYEGIEGAHEILNISRPDVLRSIHEQYLAAGANIIETNTFGGNRIKLQTYGLQTRTRELNLAGARNAVEVAQRHPEPAYILGSMGPTGKLPSSTDSALNDVSFDQLSDVFFEQAAALIEGGVDGLLLETQHDILEVKAAIIGCRKAIDASKKSIHLQVQITVDPRGKMLYGTDVLAAYTIIRDMGIDTFGINCSTGPAEMEQTVQRLAQLSSHPLSIIPNAGMPRNINGEAFYDMTPEDFSKVLKSFVMNHQIQLIGGCCGTNPGHIKAVAKWQKNAKALSKKKATDHPISSSPISLIAMKNKPIIIGERINSQGSRKAKELMLADDYGSLIDLAREQEKQNASALDICFAMTERQDEAGQIATFANKAGYTVSIPFVFDSTETKALEAGIKNYAGRPLINSINLESDKVLTVLPLLKKFGLSTIALCIDENGMAKSLVKKLDIAARLYDLAVTQYELKPWQLIFDPLTFSLATGDQEYANSAMETFSAIHEIKAKFPGVHTVLGVSNVSFGLKPSARRLVNRVYLELAVEHGLDYAIFNAAHYDAINAFSKQEISIAKNLILNRKKSSLTDLIEYFESTTPQPTSSPKTKSSKKLSVSESIQQKIIHRDKTGLIDLLNQALKTQKASAIITGILLPAMQIVGDRMDKGEIILPFVLESAEVMKLAISHLEAFLDSNETITKGTIVLATVFGDVHDIGKNLVKTIMANNGYRVIDLGKQVPADAILKTAIKEEANAIMLSALLVATSKQMQLMVEKCQEKNLNIPILVGGAAINQNFAEQISIINGKPYAGGVYYSKDAFQGLKILNSIL